MTKQSPETERRLALVRKLLAQDPTLGRCLISRQTGLTQNDVGYLLRLMVKNGEIKKRPAGHVVGRASDGRTRIPSDSSEVNVETTTTTSVVSSKGPLVRTLDELLDKAKVDRTVWEVERHIINQWETARKDKSVDLVIKDGVMTGSVDDTGKMVVQPVFQVKAWLRRKTLEIQAAEIVLSKIIKHAVSFPHIKIAKRPANKNNRSLELCVMDPHVGLLCQYPDADGGWDMNLASTHVLEAIDDLVKKASAHGPFQEVFMPFGNDFVHVDGVENTTTRGTPQPEAVSWHSMYVAAEELAIAMVERIRTIAPVHIYEIPGNHSRQSDFTLARLLKAYFHKDKQVIVDASSSPYKFHCCGVNLIGYEHGHHIPPIRLAALMANECKQWWAKTEYREWHLGDQHRKGVGNPATLEEQGVSVEYVPGITAPNEWHRLKAFSHQKRGAMSFVWDWEEGLVGRFHYNISQYHHKKLTKEHNAKSGTS
jgi:predicted transcriptional regulator